MDRTADFLGSIVTVVGTVEEGPARKHFVPPPGTLTNPFQDEVMRINATLNDLDKLLDQLASLAKYKTLFDDKTRDIELVTGRIKNSLQAATSSIDSLEQRYVADGSTKDSISHRSTVISTLRNRTMNATKQFTKALQTRRQTLETIEARRGMYVNNGSYDIEAQDDSQPQSVLMQAYHQSRSEAVEQVQRMIGEVSTMFQRIASLVGQQEEMVLRIDATVDDSLSRLREGQFQLLKYFTHIKGQRTLILKLLALLTAFAMFFIVFLA